MTLPLHDPSFIDTNAKLTTYQAIAQAEPLTDTPSAEDIKSLRRKAGMSRQELAAIVGVGWNTLRDWERGRHVPRGDASDKLRKVLGFVAAREAVPAR